MRTTNHSSCRHTQENLNNQLKNRLLILQKIWFLIVLARLLSFLMLILTYYHERL